MNMDEFTNEDTLNDVLNALKKNEINFPDNTKMKIETVLTEGVIDTEKEYRNLLNKINSSLDNNAKILEEAAQLVRMIGDDKTLEAYASVAKSNSDLLKTFSGVITERDRIRTQEKMKDKDLEVKKELAQLKGSTEPSKIGDTNIQNNFILKSSRDEMFDMIFGKPEEKEKAIKKVMGQIPNHPTLEAEIVE